MTIKITETTITFYDFMEMSHEIDKILGYDPRDAGKHFFPNSGSSMDWHREKGHDCTSSDIEYNQKINAEYADAVVKGKWVETPYMDFWHWQLDNCVGERFSNDAYSTICVSMNCGTWVDKKPEPWQTEIQ